MYEFNEQTRALADVVQRLTDEFQMPLEARKLRGETIGRADLAPGVEAARKVGLWDLNRPQELGGPDLSVVDRMAITETAFRCLVPLRPGGSALPPLYSLEGEQKARYLDPIVAGEIGYCFAQTEPHGGADPAGAIRTMATKVDGGWKINGTKVFISSFDNARICFVLASLDREKKAGGIAMFAVERDNPGLIPRRIPMLGDFVTHELIFDECFVDELAMISPAGKGFKGAQQTLSAARLNVGARAIGIAQRAYEMMVENAQRREVFGKRLADLQETQSKVVDSWVEIQQNRLMLYAAAEKADRGHDIRIECGMVKMLATEMCARVLDRAIQVFGAAGCALDNPLAHWYDHQRMARIYEGPTEVHKYRVLARQLLA
ncbi:MAG: acyl-CoA dehydrogenase [Burkholderiaceae bacterium]|nr:acyl-CoA dehydrogenase [Burkholderiaceae bacterium]